MPSANRPKPQHTEYDADVLKKITESGPILQAVLCHETGAEYGQMDCVVNRLKSQGLIVYSEGEGWMLKPGPKIEDPLSFMPAVVEWSGSGWFGPAGRQY